MTSDIILRPRPGFFDGLLPPMPAAGPSGSPGTSWLGTDTAARTALGTGGPHCVSHSCPTLPQWLWGANGTIGHRLVLDFGIEFGAE
jgi:hypothetical protein